MRTFYTEKLVLKKYGRVDASPDRDLICFWTCLINNINYENIFGKQNKYKISMSSMFNMGMDMEHIGDVELDGVDTMKVYSINMFERLFFIQVSISLFY